MKNLIIILTALLFVCLAGCSASLDVAKESYDRAMQANQQVRHALFAQAWGMNRALITESRDKYVAKTELAIVDASKNGVVDVSTARQSVHNLSRDLGQDEVVASQNFAYLSFLLMAGERADQMMGNVDSYLAAQQPIWRSLLHTAQHEVGVGQSEWAFWEPLVGAVVTKAKELLGKLQSAAVTTQ